MKKKILLFLALITIVISSLINPVNATNITSSDNNDYIKRNEEKLALAEKLNKYLLDDNGEYLDYYGGMYINDDATKLVLQIVKKNMPRTLKGKETIDSELSSIDQSIMIEYVDHSYNELLELQKKIDQYYENVDNIVAKAEFKDYVGHYIDIKNNTVNVKLLNNQKKNLSLNNDEQLNKLVPKFKENVVDSNLLNFEIETEKVHDEATIIKAGQKITATKGTCSMGYRVKLGGKVGYITAGHCFNNVGDNIITGTVKKREYSSYLDAAFVQTKSTYSPSNDLKYTGNGQTKLNNTACPILVVGSAIAHVGITTHYQPGNIIATNASLTHDGVRYVNLVLADYKSDKGDSGGAVFIPASNGEGLLVGIHKGAIGDTRLIINADNIYSAWGYSRY